MGTCTCEGVEALSPGIITGEVCLWQVRAEKGAVRGGVLLPGERLLSSRSKGTPGLVPWVGVRWGGQDLAEASSG